MNKIDRIGDRDGAENRHCFGRYFSVIYQGGKISNPLGVFVWRRNGIHVWGRGQAETDRV